MRLERLLDVVKLLEHSDGGCQRISFSEPIGGLPQFLGIDGQLVRTGDDNLPGDPTHLKSPLRHHVFGFDRSPCHGRSQSLLLRRIQRIGGGPQQDCEIDDLGDRHDPAESLDLLAQFVAKGRDQGIFAPTASITG
jgi:hypothetical protein